MQTKLIYIYIFRENKKCIHIIAMQKIYKKRFDFQKQILVDNNKKEERSTTVII